MWRTPRWLPPSPVGADERSRTIRTPELQRLRVANRGLPLPTSVPASACASAKPARANARQLQQRTIDCRQKQRKARQWWKFRRGDSIAEQQRRCRCWKWRERGSSGHQQCKRRRREPEQPHLRGCVCHQWFDRFGKRYFAPGMCTRIGRYRGGGQSGGQLWARRSKSFPLNSKIRRVILQGGKVRGREPEDLPWFGVAETQAMVKAARGIPMQYCEIDASTSA